MKNPKGRSRSNTARSNTARYFRYFVISSGLCLAGLGTVVYVNLNLPASNEQELLALAGLVLGAPSGLCAGYCYLRILFSRFENFLKNDS